MIAGNKPRCKSKVMKIALLFLALGLLIAGLYYSIAVNTGPSTVVTQSVSEPLSSQLPSIGIGEKKDTLEQKASPPVPQNKLENFYTVQVRATKDDRVAKDTVNALRIRGHDAYSEEVDLKEKGVWKRIFIGRFVSENEAQQYAQAKEIAAVFPDFLIRRVKKKVAKE